MIFIPNLNSEVLEKNIFQNAKVKKGPYTYGLKANFVPYYKGVKREKVKKKLIPSICKAFCRVG